MRKPSWSKVCSQSILIPVDHRIYIDEDLYFSKEDAYQILSQVEQLETRFSRDRSVIGELGQRRQTSQDTISIRRALAKYFARLVFGGRIS
jgi:hypothetical protein